jgi:hydrogenase maturation protease
MPRVLIIGIGNPLRSDDGIGWHAIQALSDHLADRNIKTLTLHQLTPEIAEAASRVEQIIFIDAARIGTPGAVTCKQIRPNGSSTASSHHISPTGVLKLAEDLYGRCPIAHIVTIAGESFQFGGSISPLVRSALPALVTEIRHLIGRYQGKIAAAERGRCREIEA